jgi:hypothetical protein
MMGYTVQGGATRSFPIDPEVSSVRVFLQTEGRNLEAKIEVLQGPDTVRQEIDLTEDFGYERPFSGVIDTPGYGCVIRILNTGPMAFPFKASVVPLTRKQPQHYGHADRYAQVGGGARPNVGRYDPYGARPRNRWGAQDGLGGYSASRVPGGSFRRTSPGSFVQDPYDPYMY